MIKHLKSAGEITILKNSHSPTYQSKYYMKSRFFLTFIFALLLSSFVCAQPQQLTLGTFATGFNEPLDLCHAGDDRIFVVEKDGRIHILDQQGVRNSTPFLNIDPRVNSAASERGLLGLAFHPNFQQNGYFYVNYSNASGATVISRFEVSSNPDVADANSEQILITIPQPFSNHNGGCLKFGPDGYLYIGMGDGGSAGDPQGNAQNGASLLAKMLRIDVDGGSPYGIPPSNPYLSNANVRDEIWAFGLRNPWRFSFDRVTDELWIGDVGQDDWEEIDVWPAGSSPSAPNFGWRCYEGNAPYNTAGCGILATYDGPIYVYANNISNGCSITAGFVYRGLRHKNLFGSYFFTDYCSGNLWYTLPDGNGGWITSLYANLDNFDYASFGEDKYGQLYVCGVSSGTIFKMEDTTCVPKAYIDAPGNFVSCKSSVTLQAFADPALSYQWQSNGVDIPGAVTSSYSTALPGNYTVIVIKGGCRDTSDIVALSFAQPAWVQITGLDSVYCTHAPAVMLSATLSGGTFAGPGISGNATFSPTLAGVGIHTISYMVLDSNGCLSQDSVAIRVEVCAGIAPAAQLPGFIFYPNPGRGLFHFEFLQDKIATMQIRVINPLGQIVYADLQQLVPGRQKFSLDLRQLDAGMYFLELEQNGSKSVLKIIIQM